MSKQVELEKLDRAIKDGQIRLGTVKNNLDLLDREIATLTELQSELEANVKCLKQKNIVAIATEFKKSKEDLKKTKLRLTLATAERDDFKRALEFTHKVIKDSQEAIERIKKSGENNVLHANFGKKDNG